VSHPIVVFVPTWVSGLQAVIGSVVGCDDRSQLSTDSIADWPSMAPHRQRTDNDSYFRAT